MTYVDRLITTLATASLLAAGLALGPSGAAAQSLEEEQAQAEDGGGLGSPDGADDTGAAPPADEDPALLGDEQAAVEDEAPAGEVDELSPLELEDTDYFFLGVMAQGIIIPGFIQQLFVDGGIDGFNPGLGLTFNYRRNNFNVIANVWWNGAQGDGFFRASGDPVTDTEYIDVDLGVIFLNAAFLWSFPLDDQNIIAIELGFDIGFGFIYGDLVRTEATPEGDSYRPCRPDEAGTSSYCDPPAPDPCYNTSGGHYNCREPNWTTEGGDTPLIMPWVSLPHLAVRIKPIRQVQIRVDGGYGLYNFFFGGSLSYGF